MNKEECFKLGTISRLHGFKGEVAVYLDADQPKQFIGLESVYVEINNKLVPFFIDEFRIIPKGFALVKFKNVQSETEAKALLKHELFLPLESLPVLDEDEFYFHEVSGFKVIDELHGEIGIANEVIDISMNPLLQIMKDNKEILLPLNYLSENKIDREAKIIYVRTPEGLIDLYLNDNHSERDDEEE